MATIKDVAKKAGVSISTVSLVINGKRNISADKYNLILLAIKELNYRPSLIAQNLKKQKFHIIGVIMPSTDGHYAQILKGIHDALDVEKYQIIIRLTEDDVQKEVSVFEELISMGASGIIVVPCDEGNTEKYRKWAQTGLDMVFLERKIENVDFSNVLFDNQKLVYYKTKELLSRFAPEEMALITGSIKHKNERECVVGFKDAMLETHPEVALDSLEILETSIKSNHAMYDILTRFGKEECDIQCFIVSGTKKADMLAELQDIMKREPLIYALSGDVLHKAKRNKSVVRQIPREAMKLGQAAAGLLLESVKKHRFAEKQDILVETKYDIKDPVVKKTVSIINSAPLRILLLQSNAMDILYKLSPNFTKETGIKTEFTFVPFYELIQILTGNPSNAPDHDVLWVDIPLVDTMTKMGRLLNIRSRLDKDESDIMSGYPQGVIQCMPDKKRSLYGFPVLMDEGLLHYRKDVFTDPAVQWSFFNKYGFELKPPTTWTEFNYVAEFFDPAHNKDSAFKYGTVLSLTGATAIMEEFYVRQWAFHGRMMDRWGKLCINSIENTRALENLVTAYKHSPPESLNYFYEESFASLLKGETPMVQGFATHYLPFRYSKYSDTFEAQIGVAPIPGGKPLLGGWILGINAASKMPDKAYEFLSWAIRDDLVVTKGMLGYLMPIHATYESTVLNNSYPGLKMMNVDNFSKEQREVIKNNAGETLEQFKFEEVMAEELLKALKREKTAADALSSAQAAVEILMKDQTGRQRTGAVKIKRNEEKQ